VKDKEVEGEDAQSAWALSAFDVQNPHTATATATGEGGNRVGNCRRARERRLELGSASRRQRDLWSAGSRTRHFLPSLPARGAERSALCAQSESGVPWKEEG